jgi:hypothetical protein
MEFETRAIHVGQEPDAETGAVMSPIYATSTFAQIRPGETRGYDYTRSGNPNFTRLATTLASLEGGRFATVFANGMAAITAVISTLRSGDLVLAEENVYGCTFRIFARVFEKFGVEVRYVDLADPASFPLVEELRPALVWLESPTNPMLKILDIAAISEHAARVDAPVLVDNTFASPYFQRPLELGATLSLSSTTKYVNGHSDCLGGVVLTNDEAWQEKMIFAQKAVGLNPSPFDSWLVSRGVKTLALRMPSLSRVPSSRRAGAPPDERGLGHRDPRARCGSRDDEGFRLRAGDLRPGREPRRDRVACGPSRLDDPREHPAPGTREGGDSRRARAPVGGNRGRRRSGSGSRSSVGGCWAGVARLLVEPWREVARIACFNHRGFDTLANS